MVRAIAYVVSGLLGAVLVASSAYAHNGATAFATPVSGITVDGSLDDWPEDSRLHSIAKAEYGEKPVDVSDLSGQFRVGYDARNGMLYVAVEVTDSSLIRGRPGGEWDAQDGCAVYVDRHEIKNGIQVEQYFRCGDDLLLAGAAEGHERSRGARVEVQETKGKRVYEWELPLDDISPGITLGFDVDITDKDEDGSFTWMGWGTGTEKVHYIGRIGHLHLVSANDLMQLVRVSGSVRLALPHEGGAAAVPPVSIQSIDSPTRWTIIECDENGRYATALPAGSYRVTPLDTSGLRVDERVSVECKLEVGGETKADELVVPTLKSPGLIGARGVLSQQAFDSKQLDQFVASYQRFHNVPGVSLAVIVDGKVHYSKKYGVENSVSKKALRADTVFEACSLTKPVFAFAVNRLIQKGVLDLQTPLYKYKPRVSGYEDVADDVRYRQITAQHVLTHRTGFPNWRSGKLSIDFEPGKRYGYSGEGFELLGSIVSHLTGKELVQVIDEEVFQPLEIENAYLVWNETLAKRTARGHVLGSSPIPKTRNYEPGMAHSLHIDAENYAKLLTAILRRVGLTQQTYSSMLRQQFEIANPSDPYEFSYGLGVIVEDTPFGKKYSHTGVNTGWRCRFGIYDELKMGYVVFTNSDRGDQFNEDLERFLITGREDSSQEK